MSGGPCILLLTRRQKNLTGLTVALSRRIWGGSIQGTQSFQAAQDHDGCLLWAFWNVDIYSLVSKAAPIQDIPLAIRTETLQVLVQKCVLLRRKNPGYQYRAITLGVDTQAKYAAADTSLRGTYSQTGDCLNSGLPFISKSLV